MTTPSTRQEVKEAIARVPPSQVYRKQKYGGAVAVGTTATRPRATVYFAPFSEDTVGVLETPSGAGVAQVFEKIGEH